MITVRRAAAGCCVLALLSLPGCGSSSISALPYLLAVRGELSGGRAETPYEGTVEVLQGSRVVTTKVAKSGEFVFRLLPGTYRFPATEPCVPRVFQVRANSTVSVSVTCDLKAAGKPAKSPLWVFVDSTASPSEIASVHAKLKALSVISSCRYLDKKQSYRSAVKLFRAKHELLAISLLTPATTPPVFHCQLRDAQAAAQVGRTLRAVPGVFAVTYPGMSWPPP